MAQRLNIAPQFLNCFASNFPSGLPSRVLVICRRQHFAECFCLSAFLDNFNDATLHGVVFQKFLMRHTSILRGAKGPIEPAVAEENIKPGSEGLEFRGSETDAGRAPIARR